LGVETDELEVTSLPRPYNCPPWESQAAEMRKEERGLDLSDRFDDFAECGGKQRRSELELGEQQDTTRNLPSSLSRRTALNLRG
jgi:hypothetical protein